MPALALPVEAATLANLYGFAFAAPGARQVGGSENPEPFPTETGKKWRR